MSTTAPIKEMPKSIAAMVEEAGHYLPDQAPLHAFVHHNTLHSYEHMPFKEAVKSASKTFDASPFLSEEEYAKAYDTGRIITDDIIAILEQEVPDLYEPIIKNGPMRKALLLWHLKHLFDVPSESVVRWWLHERDLLNVPHRLADSAAHSIFSTIYQVYHRTPKKGELSKLWDIMAATAQSDEGDESTPRLRDFYLKKTGIDTDEWVHPTLIRLSASYLDQGVASHAMPLRNQGFLAAFWHYIETPSLFTEPWMKQLKKDAKTKKGVDAELLVRLSLEEAGIEPAVWSHYIHETLQSLRGWAGMFRQFEVYPHKAPINRLPATLMEFLAVQITLDLAAARHAAKQSGLPLSHYQPMSTRVKKQHHILAYEAFVSAQAFGLHSTLFADASVASAWLEEHRRFNHFERRYLMHLAYERRHRHHVLDALLEHQQFFPHKATEATEAPNSPSFQTLFCMDDREESTRRYLEELTPDVETYGCSGFFGVAMQYKGLDDSISRPLCPVSIVPEHFVEEVPAEAEKSETYRKRRQRHGQLLALLRQSEHAPLHNALWTLLAAPFHGLSLIMYSLMPQWANELHHHFTNHRHYRPNTRLALFREGNEKTEDGLYRGYTLIEATDIVEELLRSMGLLYNFSPLVIAIGHGACSVNNPHQAAYNCGATGGGQGGSNARAFAMMANHPDVRHELKKRGVDIPEQTQFIGAYHDTTNDHIDYYDIDGVPESHFTLLKEASHHIDNACMHSAQERFRRFEDAPLNLSLKGAKKIAQQHATDLAQPRPEYGHATNAVCVIGRRENTQGLYFDRRAFLISYNPDHDSDGVMIADILESTGPVGAGINLEYYFSRVDSHKYGCDTKLPHNISGLLGVMNGHSSDLRTGLVWQMVELHEPVRLLVIVEATPERLAWVAQDRPEVGKLVTNEWIQLVSMHPETGELAVFSKGTFVPYQPEAYGFPVASHSADIFEGSRDHLGCAHIVGER